MAPGRLDGSFSRKDGTGLVRSTLNFPSAGGRHGRVFTEGREAVSVSGHHMEKAWSEAERVRAATSARGLYQAGTSDTKKSRTQD